jgi:hypothetical protein
MGFIGTFIKTFVFVTVMLSAVGLAEYRIDNIAGIGPTSRASSGARILGLEYPLTAKLSSRSTSWSSLGIFSEPHPAAGREERSSSIEVISWEM